MTPVDWMALLVALIVLIKAIVVSLNPKAWSDAVTSKKWSNIPTLTVVSLVILLGSLYYLIQELSILQIGATLLFFFGLMGLAFAPYASQWMDLAKTMVSDKRFMQKSMPSLVVWTALALWILYALLWG